MATVEFVATLQKPPGGDKSHLVHREQLERDR
jgi:hypothetical protein